MSHTVIQCPGCLSKLRFRSNSDRETIECPRCSENIVIAEVAQQAYSPKSPLRSHPEPAATVQKSSRRVSDDSTEFEDEFVDEFLDDYVDDEEARAKKETVIFLGLVATAILVALIAFPSAIYYLLKDDAKESPAVAENIATESAPSTALPKVQPDPPRDSLPQPTAPDHSSSPSTAEQNPAAAAAPPMVQNPPSEKPTPEPKKPPASSPANPPADVPQNPPATVAANPADADAEGKLHYRWAAGQEHIYQLTITADHGGTKQNITGSCTYTVKSDGHEHNEEREGSGSGFVVASNGIIATCAHVVEGAKRIEVTIGEKTYPAKVVVEKGKLDLALIRIEANGLTVSKLADSDKVQLAEQVRAFGFPLSTMLGTGIKVATGAVAGIVMHPQHGKQIQTDAPINPGNSGGPIVNGAGQVIGIASSKIASSAASSVGFAVPVNELKNIMNENGLAVPALQDLPNLPGPELAKLVTPTVAFIKVWGTSGGQVFDVAYSANFTQMQSFNPGQMRIGAFPMFPTSNHDRGTMKVNANGEIVEFSGKESLPYVLGPIGQFFIEPLDPYGDATWSTDIITSLRIVKREANDPLSRMRSRTPFGPRGRFGGLHPFEEEPEDETVRVIPAQEHTSYRIGPELNNRITIHKKYEFTTTQNPDRPYLSVRGTGDIVFDRTIGMPSTFEYKATITQNDEDGTVDKLPITVSYTLRDPAVVKREREAALQRAEEQKKQQQEERTTPDAELVDELLASIRKEEGAFGAHTHLQRLARIATVPEKRDEVLLVADNHRKNSNTSIQGVAAEVLCHWCTEDAADEMWVIVNDKNAFLHNAKKMAVAKLIEFNRPDLNEKLIQLMNDISLRHDIKKKLIDSGNTAEQAVLDNFDAVSDRSVRRDLVDVLQKIGSEKCVPMLEALQSGSDSLLKFAAQRALDAVRARL